MKRIPAKDMTSSQPMSDIFVSYASADRNRIRPLVRALETSGRSVFWDRTIPTGKTWRQVLDAELRQCRSVLVVWTENSVASEWVHFVVGRARSAKKSGGGEWSRTTDAADMSRVL